MGACTPITRFDPSASDPSLPKIAAGKEDELWRKIERLSFDTETFKFVKTLQETLGDVWG